MVRNISVTPVAPTPVLSPGPGQYASGTAVALSSAASTGTIRYTTDGSKPNSGSPIYTTQVPITGPYMVLRAYVSVFGKADSAVVDATYVLDAPAAPVATPTFDIPPGNLASDTAIPVSDATAGATMYYTTTTDGTVPPDPTLASAVYAGPVQLVYPFGRIKVIAAKAGMTTSAVASGAWTFDKPAIVAVAELILDPAVANIVYGVGLNVQKWVNGGTAGAALDVSQATDPKRPVWAANTGRYGGAALTFTAAAAQFLRSSVGTYAWNQPSTILAQAHQTGGNNRVLADGDAGSLKRALYFSTSSQFTLNAGATLNNNGLANSTTDWGCWWGQFNGASSVNGREDEQYGKNPPGPTTGNAGSNAANGITIGAEGNGTLPHDGPIEFAIGWKQAVVASDIVKAEEYIASKTTGTPTAFQYVDCDGDSLTAGVPPAVSYPAQLQPLLGVPAYRVDNFGVSGNKIADVQARFIATVNPLFVAGRRNIYPCWVGTNNISAAAVFADGAAILAEYYALLDLAKAAGWKPVAYTYLVRSVFNATQEAIRVALNVDIVANWAAHASALNDVAAIPQLQNYADPLYFSDGTHLTTLGNSLVAANAQAAIATIP